MHKIVYKELIDLSQNWEVQLEWSTAHHLIKGLRLSNKAYPVSITEVEARFMMDHIIAKGYKRGFELATGLGISSYAIGMGMKETGGSLFTFDNFSEERLQVQPIGPAKDDENYEALCHQMFKNIRDHYSLPIICNKISSPELYKDLWGQFDFIFFDCPKDDNDLIRDLDGIYPFLADKFTMILHDSHCFTSRGEDYFQQKFGRLYEKVKKFGEVEQFFPLAVFVKD